MNGQINQYKQIIRTYWQRPLIVLFAVLLLSLFVLSAVGRTGGNVMQIGARPHTKGLVEYVYIKSSDYPSENNESFPTLADLLERVDPDTVRSLDFTRLSGDDPLPDLSLFSNLVYLNLSDFDLTDDNVNQICQLLHLDALVYTGTRLPHGAIQRFGQKVSQLELHALTLEEHSDEISQMSKVKLLALHLFNATPDLIDHVAQVPQLQQLSLIVPQNIELNQGQTSITQAGGYINLNEQQISLLRNHPTLKEVYANWFLMKRIHKFHESEILPVRALPIRYSKNKLKAISRAMFAMALLFAILSIQLWGHFISPAAKVVPNYLIPHRRVAVGIFSVVVFLFWLTLLRNGFGMLPSLNIILFLPACCCCLSIAQLSGRTILQWLMLPAGLLIFFFISNFSERVFQNIAGPAIWFLWGYMPLISIVIIAIELIFIAGSLGLLRSITELVNEKYSAKPAFSPWDPERSRQIQWKNLEEKKPMNFFLWSIDFGMNRLKYSGGSTLQMVHLWRQGNTFRPMKILLLLLMVVFFSLIFHGIRCLISGHSLFPENPGLFSVVFGVPMGIALILPAVIWWQRRKSLDVESMRPVSRNNFARQLYLSLALDHWLAVICLMGVNIPRFFEAPHGKTEAFGLFLLIGIAGPLWIIGISSTVLVFKRSWVIVLNMFVLSLLPFAILAPVAISTSDNPPGGLQDVQILFQIAYMGIVAAIGLNVVMYRVFLNREWG